MSCCRNGKVKQLAFLLMGPVIKGKNNNEAGKKVHQGGRLNYVEKHKKLKVLMLIRGVKGCLRCLYVIKRRHVLLKCYSDNVYSNHECRLTIFYTFRY